MNEHMARGDGEQRLGDLRMIEVEDGVGSLLVCMCIYVNEHLREEFRRSECAVQP